MVRIDMVRLLYKSKPSITKGGKKMAEADKYDRARCIALPKEQEKLAEGKDEYVRKKDTSNEKTPASSLKKRS